MIWSTAEVDAGVIASIAQLYSILLSTLFSINRQQLSLFDANYALAITSSPLTVHLVSASISELLGFKTRFFERIKSHPRTIRFFGALLLPLWLGLKFTLPLSGRAFMDSNLCSDPDFWNFVAGILPLSNMICSPSMCGVDLSWTRAVFGRLLHGLCVDYVVWCTHHGSREPTTFMLVRLILVEVYWTTNAICTALLASGKGYVVSYGQV